jgi:hypothetical protein
MIIKIIAAMTYTDTTPKVIYPTTVTIDVNILSSPVR